MHTLGFLAQAYYKEKELKTFRPLSLWRTGEKNAEQKGAGNYIKKAG